MIELSKKAKKFKNYLDQRDLPLAVVELPSSTRTAVQAADSLDCALGQIVKSLVFRNTTTDDPVIVLASGKNRVEESKIAAELGMPIDKPNAKFVKQRTGYSIGGVAPIGHREAVTVFVDEDLLTYDVLWAAAGTPNAVFCIDRPITEILESYRIVPVY